MPFITCFSCYSVGAVDHSGASPAPSERMTASNV
jgi:hypothetical protein